MLFIEKVSLEREGGGSLSESTRWNRKYKFDFFFFFSYRSGQIIQPTHRKCKTLLQARKDEEEAMIECKGDMMDDDFVPCGSVGSLSNSPRIPILSTSPFFGS